jgi:hypothetical protein
MTDEEKWENCHSVGVALQLLNRSVKSANPGRWRKLRLCSCYLLRPLESVFTDGQFAHALDVAESHFDGRATLDELRAAIAEAQSGYEVHRNDLDRADERAAQALYHLLRDAREAVGAAVMSAYGVADETGNRVGLALLREMFGNPFRPVAFSPEWRTDTAVTLAAQMYEARDFSAMPILADALQDAGCDDPALLWHCRDAAQVHVRGCWVVDLVLGKA